MNFPNRGFYRGNLNTLVRDSIAAFNSLSPEEQAKHRELQRQSWVRGEMEIGLDKQEAEFKESLVPPAIDATLTSSEVARQQGFTGDICTSCGGAHMKHAGHCLVCSDCGTTTGCS